MNSQRVQCGGGAKKTGEEARRGLGRGAVGWEAVKKFRLRSNFGILVQECCPFVVASLLLCIFIYLFMHVDHLLWKFFQQ